MSFTMNHNIVCCKDCVAPKRYPGCHSKCSEYQKERAAYDTKKAEYYKRKSIKEGLDAQVISGVYRAKKQGKGWY